MCVPRVAELLAAILRKCAAAAAADRPTATTTTTDNSEINLQAGEGGRKKRLKEEYREREQEGG